MNQNLSAFQIKKDGKILDYRLGQRLDLADVANYFRKKGFEPKNITFEGRHVVGFLHRGNEKYFLKLATTEGMSSITEIEYDWNRQMNSLLPRKDSDFWVPEAVESGYYNTNLFYHLSDVFIGIQLASTKDFTVVPEFRKYIERIILMSEVIQTVPFVPFHKNNELEEQDYIQWFIKKTRMWYEGTPQDIREKYKLQDLMDFVEKNAFNLIKKPRHGDFTPWHMFLLQNGKLGLLDGEHAMADGVEYYDIAYLIQRIFSVAKDVSLATFVLKQLRKRSYSEKKLQTVMAARAIGGFLDESLAEIPNYNQHVKFKEFIKL